MYTRAESFCRDGVMVRKGRPLASIYDTSAVLVLQCWKELNLCVNTRDFIH